MSFSDFLEKMQHKPRYVRTRAVWLCVIVCMSLVVSVWLLTLKSSLSFNNDHLDLSDDTANSLQLIKKKGEQIPSLMDSLKTGIKSLFEKTNEGGNARIGNSASSTQTGSVDNIPKPEPTTSSDQNLNNVQKTIKPKILPTTEK